MGQVDADKAAKAGDFLFRYMRARHRFKEKVERPLPAHQLADLIGRGKEEFDEIYVDAGAKPPVVLDGKADDFFTAILRKNYSAMPGWEPQFLAAWRYYVLRDGPLPRKPGPRRPVGPNLSPTPTTGRVF